MRIALASDHAGFRYKTLTAEYLERLGHDVVDFGSTSEASVDYPDFIHPAARAVADGTCERGVIFGGSGNGEAITANRHRGVRCGLAWNEEAARLTRAHNDANMIAIGQRLVPEALLRPILDAWLATPFEGGRHQPRIEKIEI
jgi:ribose 5-phosphate isomerase B